MPLTDFEWSDRLAIPLPFIQAVDWPTAQAVMAEFTTWRLKQHVDRPGWMREVVTRTSHPPMATARTQTFAQRRTYGLFFHALYQKCVNLYGASDTDSADELALIRHPWALRDYEFKNAYDKICRKELPGTDIVPDRSRFDVVATLASAAPAGISALMFRIPAVQAGAALAGIGLAAAAGIEDWSMNNAHDRQDSQIRNNYDAYIAIYEREKQYRKKEVAAA